MATGALGTSADVGLGGFDCAPIVFGEGKLPQGLDFRVNWSGIRAKPSGAGPGEGPRDGGRRGEGRGRLDEYDTDLGWGGLGSGGAGLLRVLISAG